MLIDFIGPDLTNLSHEIDKLVAFSGERPSINTSDVLQVGGHSAEINVFELQNAVSRGNQKTALEIAERILQQSTNRQGEALRILAILSLFFNRLWQYTACKREGLNQAQSAERLGLGRFPFMLREYDAALGLYTYSAIRRAISTLLAADSELKGGSTRNPNLILTLSLRRLVP
jgi:DNA polymerase-3 subunit delta